jgi:glycosyltransferase involved in cell wall biosynthesis
MEKRHAPIEKSSAADTYRLAVVCEGNTYGGAERYLTNLLATLPNRVVVSVLAESADLLTRIMAGRPGAQGQVVRRRVGEIRRALAARDPDVVHLNLTSFSSCRTAAVASISRGYPTILVDHYHATAAPSWRGRAAQRLMTRFAAARVAVGDAAARDMEGFAGLPAQSVLCIPNGVPNPDCSEGRRTEGPFTVGVLARLEYGKGVDVLLRALANLPDTFALIAGEGPLRREWQQLAHDLDLATRVRFLGQVESPCLLLDEVDALVMPSRGEALPLAILEAMHAGRPVIASAVGSIPEAVVDGETGILVPPEDETALVNACRTLAEDPQLRARLGAAARTRAQLMFSVEAMATAYDRLYRTSLRHRSVLRIRPAGRPTSEGTRR